MSFSVYIRAYLSTMTTREKITGHRVPLECLLRDHILIARDRIPQKIFEKHTMPVSDTCTPSRFVACTTPKNAQNHLNESVL